ANGIVFVETTSYGTRANQVLGNYIGTDINGTAAISNTFNGVVMNNAHDNVVGSTAAGAGNLISGNGLNGVYIEMAIGARVRGNYIGTDASGTADLGNGGAGVYIKDGGSNAIGGSAAGARNLISGNNGSGVYITGYNARSNTVFANYIGTNAAGTGPLGNSDDGVTIRERAINNEVGNGGATGRNIISGNLRNGVLITGTLASEGVGNRVWGNYIGTTVDGSAPVSNTLNGVALDEASYNQIGDWGTRNVISGNGRNGVLISGTTSSNNYVRGNYIGTNADGTLNVGNASSGVSIVSASNNIIGGTNESYRNVISGNFDGVRIARLRAGQFADNNLIQGNFLGTNASGTAAIGNYVAGVSLLIGARNTVVGGAQPEMRNLISGNVTFGVIVSSANDTKIQNNYIGTNASASGPVPNQSSGIYISDGYTNTIGGGVGLGNLVAYNGEDGVFANGGASNVINTNSIYSNIKLGINLGSSNDWQFGGVSVNDALDPDDGPNKVQNYPVLSASSTQSQIKGSLNSLPNTTFTIEFFTNDTCDATGYGEGKTFLGTTVVSTGG
ncbi:MAG TPA: hypothetical protein VFG99_12045, partial [Chloroflexia bacterium]|nr:hypothetical protein [Chloroflexia bacterium]